MPFLIPGAPATTFTGNIQDSMVPWAPAGSEFDLYNQALGQMFETVYSIVADQGSPDDPANFHAGWSKLLDPVACSSFFPVFLPWLALFVGAVVPIGAATDTALASILGEQGFSRGQGFGGTYTSSNGALGGPIVTAAQSQLTGTQSVTLIERTGPTGSPDPYAFVLVVTPEELISLSALEAAVAAVKPGGVMFTVTVTDAWTWVEAENTWSADTMTWDATATTRP